MGALWSLGGGGGALKAICSLRLWDKMWTQLYRFEATVTVVNKLSLAVHHGSRIFRRGTVRRQKEKPNQPNFN